MPWDSGIWDTGSWDALPPVATFHPKPTRRKSMPKASYIKSADEEFSTQLLTFKNNIGAYTATLGVTAPQVAAQAADATYFEFLVACQQIARNFGQQCTAWKDLIRDGGEPPSTGMPVVPPFPTPPPVVAPGLEARFRGLAQQLKKHPAYNAAIGEALGIEGAAQDAPDLSELRPEISARVVGSRVEIEWGWQGQRAFLDLCELQVDRGSGWGILAFDSTPGYVDTQPFPASPTRWRYRAIYRKGDQQVGQWSQEASVVVG